MLRTKPETKNKLLALAVIGGLGGAAIYLYLTRRHGTGLLPTVPTTINNLRDSGFLVEVLINGNEAAYVNLQPGQTASVGLPVVVGGIYSLELIGPTSSESIPLALPLTSASKSVTIQLT